VLDVDEVRHRGKRLILKNLIGMCRCERFAAVDGESGGGIVFPTDGFGDSVVLVLYNRGEKLLKGR
jgi:hypothetical protein